MAEQKMNQPQQHEHATSDANKQRQQVAANEALLKKTQPIQVKNEQNTPKRNIFKNLQPKKVMERIANLQEAAIAIDTFEDLFSDFDPRDYTKRDISDDFIREINRRYKESGEGQIEVNFYIPRTMHNELIEKIIVQRLKQHFRHIANRSKKEITKLRARGLIYIGTGIAALSFLTIVTYFQLVSDLKKQLLDIIFLPLGWFGIWEGFSKIVDVPWKLQNEYEFNHKLGKANYNFKFIQ